MRNKKLGVIVGVDGTVATVGMYEMSNDVNFIWNGELLSGPKIGAFLTINQNDKKIIASVINEKIIDQQNNIKSAEFDNRYRKDSINRVVQLKTRGVISENEFTVTSSYVPMIGNEVSLTNHQELNVIFKVSDEEEVIEVGKSILENQPIKLSINNFFASHIGIFGNTGSGKSNTLHKLYLMLFQTKFREKIFEKSQFFVIDFNGEYIGDNIFGVDQKHKKVFQINTHSARKSDKISVTEQYLFNADILSILFDARPATQVPFLRSAIELFNQKYRNPFFNFGKFVVGTLKRILTTGTSSSQDSLQDWVETAKKYVDKDDYFSEIDQLEFFSSTGAFRLNSIYFNAGSVDSVAQDEWDAIKLPELQEALSSFWVNGTVSPIKRLQAFLEFQKVHRTAWGKINRDFLNPLFHRIQSTFSSLEKIITIVDKSEIGKKYAAVNIFSLVNANQEITRLVPMLISKMFYDIQKAEVSGGVVSKTKHLIIDEAHNILNAEHKSIGDDWQDYRMSIFEEIIKEGRKFGFFLTLSSQRPADISPTIVSQIHNFFIHRLINEKDLQMLENTMPTLDKSSFSMIPSLGKGEVVITGSAMQVPVFVKISKEPVNRPNSDDVKLTDIWN